MKGQVPTSAFATKETGAAALKANGAYVIAQDEATSVVWGMPGAVAAAGLANCVIPLDAVVPEILRQVGKG